MFKKLLAKSILSLAVLAAGLFATACAPKASPETMGPEQEPHPRHDTGLDSQVSDA